MKKRPGLVLILTVGLVVGLFVVNLLAQNTPSLGLDLQGGASVTLEPEGEFDSDALNVAVEIIRQRVDSLGVAEPEIIRQGNTVVVNLPGVKDQQAALDLIGRTGEVQLRQVLQVGVAEDPATTTTVVGDAPSDSVPANPTDTTLAEPTGGFGSSRVAAGTDQTPIDEAPTDEVPVDTVPDFAETTEDELPVSTVDEGAAGGQEVLPGAKDGLVYIVGPVAATGQVFSNDATADIVNGQWVVLANLRGGAGGEDLWNLIAGQCYSGSATCPTRQLAIVLDGEVISAPVVEQPSFTGGDVQISGSFSEREARDLAKILQFGAVPVKFEAPTAQTVSATLGKDSLNAAIVAGIVGILLVMIYLLAYYGLIGLVAIAGLSLSGLLTYTIIAWLSKTNGLALTLSGAAGLIVSIGVSVDSYIVYFEKLKEDVKQGRLLRNAAQRSFETTWRTILAAGLVSLIGAVTLWLLTVGSVRGFAFFLGLATTVDLIISYVFTRSAVVFLSRTNLVNRRRLLGIKVNPSGAVS
jgi:preprotein translocase subunit SecD